jgi:outer membrane protein assembly factor BamA
MKARNLILVFVIFFPIFLFSSTDEKPSSKNTSEEKKNKLVILPVVFFTPLTKIAGGVGGIYYWRTLEDQLKESPSTILMDLIYTQRKQILAELTPSLFFKKGVYHLAGYLGFKNFSEKFYGIGPRTTKEIEEDFSYRSVKLSLSLRRRFTTKLYFGLQYDFEYFNPREFETGGILDTGEIVGSDGGTVSGLGVIFVRDGRDDIFFPAKGTFFQAAFTLYKPQLGSDYSFQKFNLDFRQYVSLFSNHVLAFQESINSASGTVPFQWLHGLGGPWVMRGYIQGRYRDKKTIFVQMEYRIPLLWRLSVVGFFGCGNVADEMSHFDFSDLKLIGGWGIRYQLHREVRTNVRLDFGFAKGSFGVYVMINEAF